MVLLADLDIAWTFSQMVTADIFVHSKSTLSIAAGVLNTEVGGFRGTSAACRHLRGAWAARPVPPPLVSGCPSHRLTVGPSGYS